MKKLKACLPGYDRISATALVYMLSVVCVCIGNILHVGPDTAIYCGFFIELLGLVIVCEIIDWLLPKLIHNWTVFLLTEVIVITLVCLGFALWRGWMGCRWEIILRFSIAVVVIYASVYIILTVRNRRDAEAINRQVQEQSFRSEE